MFGFLKNGSKQRLQKEYEAVLGKAMAAQRSGDIRSYSELSEKAEEIRRQIESTAKQAE